MFVLLAASLGALLQQQPADSVVRGRVADSTSRAPLAGAAVRVAGTTTGVLTDADGAWRLVLPDSLRARTVRLRVSRLGYTPLERAARAGDSVALLLVPTGRTLEAVTVTALRGEADAPIAQTTVSAEELQHRYSGQELPFILETTPGVTAYSEGGAYGNYSYVRLRGIDQSRINVTLDGVPLTEPEDAGLFYSNYPDLGNSLQSVQVQRGVGTTQQGTASFGGAINFESASLAATPRGGDLQLGGGSFGTWRGSAEYATGVTPSGFAAYGRVTRMGTQGYRDNSGSHGESAWTSAGWFGAHDVLKLTAFTGRTQNEMAWAASTVEEIRHDPRTNPLREADDYHTSLVSLSHAHAFGTHSSLQTTAYYVDFAGAYDVNFDPGLWRYGLGSRLMGAFSTWSAAFGAVSLDVGAHGSTYRRDHWAAEQPDIAAHAYDNDGRKYDGALFAKARWGLGRLTLFGDVQARRAVFEYQPSWNAAIAPLSVAWNFVNPKAGARVRLTSALEAFASVGATGREPTRSDMFGGLDDVDSSSVGAVGDLRRVHPERVRDTEAGLAWRSRTLSAQLDVYSMDFRHEIAPIGQLTAIGTPLRKNVPRSYRRGAELDLAWHATRALTATGNVAVTHARIASFTDDASGLVHRNVDYLLSPRVVTNQGLAWRALPSLRLSVDSRYVGRAFLDNTGNRDFVLPPSWIGDAAAEWTLGRASVLAQLRNLADARAYLSGYDDGSTSYYYVQAPRNVMVTVTTRF